jgi:hypothetical protein
MAMIAFLMMSCQNQEGKSENSETENTEAVNQEKAGCCMEHVKSCDGTMTADKVLAEFENMADQEVSICGKVTHVCVHSGKRLFIAAEESEDVVVVTSEEKFPEELLGQMVVVKGKIVLGEVEHDHDIAEDEHIEDEQHEKAHAKTFMVEASSCKICDCPSKTHSVESNEE